MMHEDVAAALPNDERRRHLSRLALRSGRREPTLGTRCQPVPTIPSDGPITSVPERFMVSGQQVLAVVDDDGRPVGIVRAADLIRTVDAHQRSSLQEMTAGDVATTCTILDAAEPVTGAAVHMAHQRQDFALVVDAGGRAVGLWTAADALVYQRRLPQRRRDSGLRARDFMKPAPIVQSEDPASLLPEGFRQHATGLFVVVDRVMRPIGSVTPVELMVALSHVQDADGLDRLAIAEITTPGVTRVDADESLDQVAITFGQDKASWVAVCEGASMVGILRADELLSHLCYANGPTALPLGRRQAP